MGVWGFYDDENDDAQDASCDFADEIQTIERTDQKKIFEVAETYINTLDESCGTGLFLLVCEYVNGGSATGCFGDRLSKIMDSMEKSGDSEVIAERLRGLQLDDPRVVSKRLLQTLIDNVDESLEDVESGGWVSKDERRTALQNERAFFVEMQKRRQSMRKNNR